MVLAGIENEITDSVEKLSESVVTIRSTRLIENYPFSDAKVNGSGSGLIVDRGGHIITNYHVIQDSDDVEVMLKDGTSYLGKVVGGDRATDIAVIKVEGKNLPAADLGDSEKLKVGQFALAIGNALDLPGAPTVSVGSISAIGRPMPWADFIFEGLLQTDAAINPGNSGGPLADISGKVIGINSAIIPFAQGVGFAIPINTVKWVLEQVMEKGRVTRPMLGVSVINVTPALSRRFRLYTEEGVIVANVSSGGPAERSGLREGDIIQRVGQYEIKSVKDLLRSMSQMHINESVQIRFIRGKSRQETKLRLVEMPVRSIRRQ